MTPSDFDEAILAHIRTKAGSPMQSERLIRIAERMHPERDPARVIHGRLMVLKRARMVVYDRARTGGPGVWREAWKA